MNPGACDFRRDTQDRPVGDRAILMMERGVELPD